MKLSNEQIVTAVDDYRKKNEGRCGPPSLRKLAAFIAQREDGVTLSAQQLSDRLTGLVKRRLLEGIQEWVCPNCEAPNQSDAEQGFVTCSACETVYTVEDAGASLITASLTTPAEREKR